MREFLLKERKKVQDTGIEIEGGACAQKKSSHKVKGTNETSFSKKEHMPSQSQHTKLGHHHVKTVMP